MHRTIIGNLSLSFSRRKRCVATRNWQVPVCRWLDEVDYHFCPQWTEYLIDWKFQIQHSNHKWVPRKPTMQVTIIPINYTYDIGLSIYYSENRVCQAPGSRLLLLIRWCPSFKNYWYILFAKTLATAWIWMSLVSRCSAYHQRYARYAMDDK